MCTHAHRLIKNEIVSKIWHFLSSCFSIFNHTLFKRNSTLAYFTFSEMCQLVWISNIWFCTKQPECLICFWVSIFMTVFLWLWSREIFFQRFSRWNYVSGLYCQIYPTVLVLWLNCLKLDPYFFVVVDVRYHNMTHFCGLWLASSSSSFEKLPGRQPLFAQMPSPRHQSLMSTYERAFTARAALGSWRSAHTLHQNLVFINSPVPFHWKYSL